MKTGLLITFIILFLILFIVLSYRSIVDNLYDDEDIYVLIIDKDIVNSWFSYYYKIYTEDKVFELDNYLFRDTKRDDIYNKIKVNYYCRLTVITKGERIVDAECYKINEEISDE